MSTSNAAPPPPPVPKKKSSILRLGCLLFFVVPLAMVGLFLILTMFSPAPPPTRQSDGKDAFKEAKARLDAAGVDWAEVSMAELGSKSLERFGNSSWNPAEKEQFIEGFNQAYQDQLLKESLELARKRIKEQQR